MMNRDQRFNKNRHCPICNGHPDLAQGKGVRCTGYLSEDGQYAYCSREEVAGTLSPNTKTNPVTFAHRLNGPCNCGKEHGAPLIQNTNQQIQQSDFIPRMPAPDYAPIPSLDHYQHGSPSMKWEYKDSAGRRLFFIARYDIGEGKTLCPWTFGTLKGKEGWHMRLCPSPRPLYGLPELAQRPEAIVLVVEGEKAKDAAQERFPDMVAITWPGGSNGVAHADWTPIRGRNLILWPDADLEGEKAMAEVIRQASKAGAAAIHKVTLPDYLPPKWDLADEGLTTSAIWELMNQAECIEVQPTTEEETPRRFKILSLDDIDNLPPISWLIEQHVKEHGLTLIYGQANVGKSFFVMDMALSVASGIDWNGKPTKKGRVLYIAGEGIDGVKARNRAWRKHHGIEKIDTFHAIGEGPDLLNDEEELLKEISTLPTPPDLTIFDTLAMCFSGDENSAKDMGDLVKTCKRVQKATGGAVVLVHHSGVNGSRERGSTSLGGAIDTKISLDLVGEEGSGRFTVKCEKQKEAAFFGKTSWRLKVVPLPELGPEESSCVAIGDEAQDTAVLRPKHKPLTGNQKKILDELRMAKNGLRQCDLARITGLAPASVKKVIDKLSDLNMATHNRSTGNWFYQATPSSFTSSPLLRGGKEGELVKKEGDSPIVIHCEQDGENTSKNADQSTVGKSPYSPSKSEQKHGEQIAPCSPSKSEQIGADIVEHPAVPVPEGGRRRRVSA